MHTFLFIKIVSCSVWPWCLLLQVSMTMAKCLRTYYIIVSTLKNFLRRQKSSTVNRKIVTFYIILNHLWVEMAWKSMKLKKSPYAYVFVYENCFMCPTTMLCASASPKTHPNYPQTKGFALKHHQNDFRQLFVKIKILHFFQNFNFGKWWFSISFSAEVNG